MITKTNYNELIPEGVLFNLADIQEMKLLRIPTAKKMIDKGLIEIVKVGNKIHISRTALIRYLEDQTIPVEKTA